MFDAKAFDTEFKQLLKKYNIDEAILMHCHPDTGCIAEVGIGVTKEEALGILSVMVDDMKEKLISRN